MSSKSVIVIGGGLAGLSAAVALAEAGYRITLLEQRPFLGGRASSYLLPNGEHVDNCQHITLGCCTNLDDFYRRVGASKKILYYDRFLFSSPDGRRGELKSSWLPGPLHLSPSMLTFPLLSLGDKIAIGRALAAILFSGGRPKDLTDGDRNLSLLEWLERHHQTPTTLSRFWGSIIESALDEKLERTDARYGVDVFWKAFIANRNGYKFGVPAVALGELYDGCWDAIVKRGGEVRFRAPVRRMDVDAGAASGVSIEGGETLAADYYVSAVPQNALPALLPAEIAEREPVFANLSNLRVSPITGVHLWFDRIVMTDPYLTLLDMTTQWIFNKTLLYGRDNAAAGSGQYLQLVISASYELVEQTRQEIVDKCIAEVRRVLPASRDAQLVKSTVIKETAATFSPEPGCDRWRPGAVSPVRNLFLAGDWTATGWPATMEGAVRSGYLAGEALTAADGQPRRFLKADLPLEGISRFFAKKEQNAK
jgi:squalene-associated FAD-dependent desaturase